MSDNLAVCSSTLTHIQNKFSRETVETCADVPQPCAIDGVACGATWKRQKVNHNKVDDLRSELPKSRAELSGSKGHTKTAKRPTT